MKLRVPLLVVALVGALAFPLSTGAGADHASGPSIHPGVQTYTEGAQCTANFVFGDGTNTYLGQAAHCSGLGAATDTNGCEAESLPDGTPVTINGASRPGTMVYNSWNAMKAAGETDPDVCAFNDFALIRLDPADAGRVSPTVPFWGGPVCINTAGTDAGDDVFSYGNSSLRLGVSQLSPKQGTSLGTDAGGWNHTVYTASPGIPGDSGSAFLDANGCALGTLSTLQALPFPGGNGVGDLFRELSYMQAHSELSNVTLTLGGTFSPSLATNLPRLLGR